MKSRTRSLLLTGVSCLLVATSAASQETKSGNPADADAAKKAYDKCLTEAAYDYPACLRACPSDQTGTPALECKQECDKDLQDRKKQCKKPQASPPKP
jgi:hypothetical protein